MTTHLLSVLPRQLEIIRSIHNKNRSVPTLVHTINSNTDGSDISPGIHNIPSATINITLRSEDHNVIYVHVNNNERNSASLFYTKNHDTNNLRNTLTDTKEHDNKVIVINANITKAHNLESVSPPPINLEAKHSPNSSTTNHYTTIIIIILRRIILVRLIFISIEIIKSNMD